MSISSTTQNEMTWKECVIVNSIPRGILHRITIFWCHLCSCFMWDYLPPVVSICLILYFCYFPNVTVQIGSQIGLPFKSTQKNRKYCIIIRYPVAFNSNFICCTRALIFQLRKWDKILNNYCQQNGLAYGVAIKRTM